MNAGKAVYGILSANSGVTDLVGTRIFPEIAEQEAATPFIVYQLQSVAPEDTHDGPSKLDEVRFEFLCYADTYDQAADVGVKVRAALDRVSGTYNDVNVESVQFNDVDIEIEYQPRRYSQVLKFTFRIKRDDFTIAQGTPVTGAQLGQLSDVDVDGVTNGQLIAYNSTSGNWEAANDAGGAESLNDLSDVTITGTPTANQALIYNATTSVFEALANFTNRFEDEVERGSGNITPFVERAYGVKSDGDGIFIDNQSDTPTAGKVIIRKIYHKAGFITDTDVIGDYTLIHTFADDTAYSATTSTFEGFRDGDTYGTPPFTLIQTWEEQTAAPAFTGLLNESYGSGAAAAYSVRRLNGNVTDCMVIRRASDSTTTTIGFDGSGNIDESAINTFCSGTTCTVVTWKDQSGNSVDASAVTEGTIYDAGALKKINGTLYIDGGTYDASFTGSSTGHLFMTLQRPTISGTQRYIANSDSTNKYYFFGYDGNTGGTESGVTVNSYRFNGITASSVNRDFIWDNTANQTQATVDVNDSSLINRRLYYSGFNAPYYQEFIYYSSTKSTANRNSIESNIGDYFTQNTPLLDTYTGAAAAYSLRKLRSAYSGSAIRVRRASDNTEQDIGFNVFGELDTVSLASFCSGTDGFVKTWYCQSGNANDATQTNTSNQPKIYDSSTGVTLNSNSKPAVYFQDGVSNSLPSTVTHGSDPIFISAVSEVPSGATNERSNIYGGGGANDFEFRNWANDQVAIRVGDGSTVAVNAISGSTVDQVILLTGYNVSSSLNLFLNGTASASNPVTASYSVTFPAGGIHESRDTIPNYISEVVVYESDQSSNRSGIESNIATYHGITI